MSRPWVVVTGDFRLRGGQDRANYELALYLAQRGVRVHLVAHAVDEGLLQYPTVEWHPVRRPLRSHLLGHGTLARAARAVASQIQAEDPSVIVVSNGGNCIWPGVSWMHCVHNAWPVRDPGAPLPYRVKNRIAKALAKSEEREALRTTRLVIANSRLTRAQVLRLGLPDDRVEVVYLGVDPAAVASEHQGAKTRARQVLGVPEGRVYAFVGVLGYDSNKGLDTLLKACRIMGTRSALPIHLAVAGTGRLEFWRRVAARHGMADRVRWLGFIEDTRSLILASDALISPTRYDGYGLAVHEALALGRPAFVSVAAGISERFPAPLRCLLLADPENPRAVADTVIAWERAPQSVALAGFSEELRAETWHAMAQRFVATVERNFPI